MRVEKSLDCLWKIYPSNPDIFCFPLDGSFFFIPQRLRVGPLCLLGKKGSDQYLPVEMFRRNVAKRP